MKWNGRQKDFISAYGKYNVAYNMLAVRFFLANKSYIPFLTLADLPVSLSTGCKPKRGIK
jgi:hypothetical protein